MGIGHPAGMQAVVMPQNDLGIQTALIIPAQECHKYSVASSRLPRNATGVRWHSQWNAREHPWHSQPVIALCDLGHGFLAWRSLL